MSAGRGVERMASRGIDRWSNRTIICDVAVKVATGLLASMVAIVEHARFMVQFSSEQNICTHMHVVTQESCGYSDPACIGRCAEQRHHQLNTWGTVGVKPNHPPMALITASTPHTSDTRYWKAQKS